jgi:5-methylcytosine-specific restriction endonuclease McrA
MGVVTMPNAPSPSRLCRDCTNRAINDTKYCAGHQTKNKAADHKLLYDRYRSNDPIRLLYKKRRWLKGTKLTVTKRDPLCVECGHRATKVVDHHPLEAREIVARFGVDAFYDPTRCRGLCKQCHDIKTATTTGFAKQGKTGTPNENGE